MLKNNYFITHWLKPVLLSGASALALSSCQKEAESPADSVYAVAESQARTAAENIVFSEEIITQRQHKEITGDTQRVFQGRQQVLNLLPILASDGKPGVYVCNYRQGGFAVIAADQHMKPILAFAEHGSLPVQKMHEANALPPGLVDWLTTTGEIAAALRKNAAFNPAAPGAAASWKALVETQKPMPTVAYVQASPTSGPLTRVPANNDPPPPSSTQVGPLLQTNWGQGPGYNDYVPSSSDASYNYHCPTGCVATAQAQVMNYWRYPAYFNWASMLPNSGTPATATLMSDLGGKLHMQYAASGSGTDDDYIDDALRGNYGYRSANYNSSDDPGLYQSVIGNLNSLEPVILGGFSGSNWFGYGTGSGHCWVCDGYIQSYFDGNGYLSFHMNWGWGDFSGVGGTYNCWCAYNDWRVTDGNGNVHVYNYARSYTLDIHP
jgi:hypothetical protein